MVFVTLGNQQLTLVGSRSTINTSRPSDPMVALPMREANNIANDGAALRERLEQDGYLLLRGFLPREQVLDAFKMIVGELHDRDWLAGEDEGGVLVDDSYPHPSAGSLGTYNKGDQEWNQALMHKPEALQVVESPLLRCLFEQIFETAEVDTYYRKWLRAVPPGKWSSFHMDNAVFGRGTPNTLTAWIPFHDIKATGVGGLAVLEGSGRLPGFERMRQTYAKDTGEYSRVSYTNDDGTPAEGVWSDSLELLAFDPDARWVTTDYSAGDVLIFDMFTMHGSLVNNTPNRLRLNADVRYQRSSELMDPRYSPDKLVNRDHEPVRSETKTVVQAKRDWGLFPEKANL